MHTNEKYSQLTKLSKCFHLFFLASFGRNHFPTSISDIFIIK